MSTVPERVLAACVEVVEERGVDRLSLREVARRAGLSHQAPYHHFGNRDGLLAALVGRGFAELAGALSEAVDPDPVARLQDQGLRYLTFAQANRAVFRLMFRGDVVPYAELGAAQADADRAFHLLADTIRACRAEGRGRHLPEDDLVHLAWSAVHGAAVLLVERDDDQGWEKACRVPQTLRWLLAERDGFGA